MPSSEGIVTTRAPGNPGTDLQGSLELFIQSLTSQGQPALP